MASEDVAKDADDEYNAVAEKKQTQLGEGPKHL